MVLINKLTVVEQLIRSAVRNNHLLSYKAVLIACDTASMTDAMDTYEQAGNNIAPPREAIFGALLANKTGLPGSGFFNTYGIVRPAQLALLAPGHTNEMHLSPAQMHTIADDERRRIRDLHHRHPL